MLSNLIDRFTLTEAGIEEQERLERLSHRGGRRTHKRLTVRTRYIQRGGTL